jgi:tetratricopeptide (TPR) repeat protein
MRIVIGSLISLFLFASPVSAQTDCLQTAGEIQPKLSTEQRRDFQIKLSIADADFRKAPSADNSIWLGRRTAYLGRYKEAIAIFTDAIAKYPKDARLYRHRGHRFITLRCFDDAIKDFEKAAKLVKGKPDEVELDGLPNARNIPTSTLQSNIWYHLGLAHYLKGDFGSARKAYREVEKVSKNPDMMVATTHWLYMTLRRLGREKEASALLAPITDNLEVIENADYYQLIKLYQGKLKPSDLLSDANQMGNSLSNATVGYGVGNWFLYNGRRTEAENTFRQIVLGIQWASFGHIAAEVELTR